MTNLFCSGMANLVCSTFSLCLLMVIISCIPSDGLGTFCRPQRCPYVIGRIPLRQHNSPSIAACLLFQHTTTAITLSTPATPSDEELDQSNLALEAPSDVDSRTRTSSTSRCIGSNSSINATTSVAALEDDDTPRLSLWQGRLLIIAAAAIYGTNFATVKVLDVSMTVGSAAAARFTIAAAAVCLPIWVQETTNHLRSSKQMVDVTASSIKLIKGDDDNTMYSNQTDGRWPATWFGAEVGAWYCIGYIFQALGLETVDAGKSAFVNTLAVIVVPVLDALFKGKALSPRGIGSVALAIGGVGLLNLGPTSQQLTTAATANFFSIGDAYCLLQALFFGIGYWRLESASVRYPDESVRLTAGQLAAIAAGSIVYWLVADGGGLLENVTQLVAFVVRDPFVWKALVWTGLFSTALAIYLETVALRVVSATELTVLMTSVSLWGSAFAYVLTGEVLPVVSMVGGLLILTGCILTATGKQSTDP